jgi:peptide/nickel transport system permease protein
MGRYLARRLLATVPVILGVTLAVFAMLHLVPGDPVRLMLGEFQTTPAQIEQLRANLDLDRPLYEQYLRFVFRAVQGDLGYSIRSHRPVTQEIRDRIGSTMLLALSGLSIAVVLGVTLGVVAAVKQNTWADISAMLIALLGVSMPSFWLGLLLIMLFAVHLEWLPTSGRGSFAHIVMPAIALSGFFTAAHMRIARSSMLDVLGSEYIKLARLKGLPERRVIVKHAFKNALIPVLTLAGINLVLMINVAVVVETIFAWPGIGRLLYEGIEFRDFPIVQTVILLGGVMVVAVNLLVDILYAWIDPRIRAV